MMSQYLMDHSPPVVMLNVAVGHSNDPESESAIAEVLAQCAETLAGETPKAGILISAIDFDHALILDRIHKTYPDIQLIGGTSVGEMSSVLGFQEDSVTLMLFASDEIEMRAGGGRNLAQDTIAAAQQAVAEASETLTQPIKLCLTFADGLGCDTVALLDGLTTHMGSEVPIYGGLAGDDWQFKTTYQFLGREVLTNAVTVLLFAGNLLVSCGVATGQSPIGKPGIVTQASGSTIYQVDGRPATEFMFAYFGKTKLTGGATIGSSIAVIEADESNYYLRASSSQDDEVGSITWFGRVPEQSSIQVTTNSIENLLTASETAVTAALKHYPGTTPIAALIVSCASRLKNLGTRTSEEYELAQIGLPTDIPIMGFHAFGELSPFQVNQKSHFHNETFTILLLGVE
jgi:hypothetical protein